MQRILFIITCLIHCIAISQDSNVLRGKIIADTLQVDPIHIINLTKGLGTVNDGVGFFQIKANVGDTIVFSSVRHQQKIYVVKKKDIKKAALEVMLEIKVNELEEVLVSQYDLSGKIEEDVDNIKTYQDNLPMFNAKELDTTPYIHEKGAKTVKNIVMVDEMDITPFNFIAVGRMIADLFRNKDKKPKKQIIIPKVFDYYKGDFLVNELKIPETELHNFLDFINGQTITKEVLNSGNELKVLKFIMDQAEIFKEKYDIKK